MLGQGSRSAWVRCRWFHHASNKLREPIFPRLAGVKQSARIRVNDIAGAAQTPKPRLGNLNSPRTGPDRTDPGRRGPRKGARRRTGAAYPRTHPQPHCPHLQCACSKVATTATRAGSESVLEARLKVEHGPHQASERAQPGSDNSETRSRGLLFVDRDQPKITIVGYFRCSEYVGPRGIEPRTRRSKERTRPPRETTTTSGSPIKSRPRAPRTPACSGRGARHRRRHRLRRR